MTADIAALVADNLEIVGDVLFSGGLRVDGTIEGNVLGKEGERSLLVRFGPADLGDPDVGPLTVRTDGETAVAVGDPVFATPRAGREHRFRGGARV